MTDTGRWRTLVAPAQSSERGALASFLVGFVLEAVSEVYQLATDAGSAFGSPVGYYLSLAFTVLGFYFFWRGTFTWARLPSHPDDSLARRPAWVGGALLVGGIVTVALWNVAARTVGHGNTPAPFAWIVGGVFAWAVGSFFLALRDRIAARHGGGVALAGWAAFAGSLAIAVVSGLLLGQVFFGLVVDFFTNWATLIEALGPFVAAVSPLCVPFTLIAVVYAIGLRSASSRTETLRPRRPRPRSHTGSGATGS